MKNLQVPRLARSLLSISFSFISCLYYNCHHLYIFTVDIWFWLSSGWFGVNPNICTSWTEEIVLTTGDKNCSLLVIAQMSCRFHRVCFMSFSCWASPSFLFHCHLFPWLWFHQALKIDTFLLCNICGQQKLIIQLSFLPLYFLPCSMFPTLQSMTYQAPWFCRCVNDSFKCPPLMRLYQFTVFISFVNMFLLLSY